MKHPNLFLYLAYPLAMTLKSIYRKYPSHAKAIAMLEEIKWPNGPICPYCLSKQFTPLPNESRYHCNVCNASFSVTVDSLFKRTRADLQKWFLAIHLLKDEPDISARTLGEKIEATKDSAWLMIQKINRAKRESKEFIESIENELNK
ncbi:MAG: transposase [Chitinophagaceae bacterium]|nr:transposase [Chitinophagaceae bacterium]